MRERLVATLVGLTIAVIGLYGIPRAYFVADLVRDRETTEVERTATVISLLVVEREADGGVVDEELLESGSVGSERVEYVAVDGRPVVSGSPVDTDDDSTITETRRLGSGATLTVSLPGTAVQQEVREAIEPLVVLGVALALLAAGVGFVIARRLSRPFQELAGTARALGHGRFDLEVPRYAVPEADAIATALRSTAGQLDDLVRREREFAVNASHQLRTPITALRLELEDLTLWPQTPPDVAEHLDRSIGELDRLSSAIDELLDLARGRRRDNQIRVDLAALVADAVQRWQPRAAARSRRIVAHAEGVIPARLAPGPVVQVLDVLIDNALLHGDGTVSLDTKDLGYVLRIRISDEGIRDFGTDVFRRGVSSKRATGEGNGVGLAVASELAEAAGGHLLVDDASENTSFVLVLPRPEGEPAQAGARG